MDHHGFRLPILQEFTLGGNASAMPAYQFATTKRTFIFMNASENLVTC
ncbi:MAG: hypothetical protein OJF47_004215 [Nitrospira sp.]|nr:MAG: hypothetical protein OJF47_004215 [Nitrospira sp.]